MKVFTILLRRSESTLAAIGRRRVRPGSRQAVIRHLRLALLYLLAIGADFRRSADVIRARTGSRVFNVLRLAARTQRDAVRRAIREMSQPRKEPTPRGNCAPVHSEFAFFAINL